MNIKESYFGSLEDGRKVSLFTLVNDNKMVVTITNYGAIITSIVVPDNNGAFENIALGFDKLEHYTSKWYLGNYPYFGCVCGRVANRIANGRFILDGKEYRMAINNGPNHLHGGLVGFDRKLWEAEIINEKDKVGVKLHYLSPDGEENYPGNLDTYCIYTLNNQNELGIEYKAATDNATILNLTNHTYFNLTGGKEKILDHELQLPTGYRTYAIDLIPTGEIISVASSPYDFTSKKKFSTDINQLPEGYDLNYVLDNPGGDLVFAGCLSEAGSGRKIEVYTTCPGIQLYTGYWIAEMEVDGVKKFGSYTGIALETQHFPDSINHDNFPSVVLRPGETYNQKTIYKFSS
jgi:aldose 1-epimerase